MAAPIKTLPFPFNFSRDGLRTEWIVDLEREQENEEVRYWQPEDECDS